MTIRWDNKLKLNNNLLKRNKLYQIKQNPSQKIKVYWLGCLDVVQDLSMIKALDLIELKI